MRHSPRFAKIFLSIIISYLFLQETAISSSTRSLPLSGLRRFRHHVPGNLLIVTHKSGCEEWAAYFRAQPHTSLLIYSEPLAKRRRMGIEKIANYDVVIVTFDVLCAKELKIPGKEFIGFSSCI